MRCAAPGGGWMGSIQTLAAKTHAQTVGCRLVYGVSLLAPVSTGYTPLATCPLQAEPPSPSFSLIHTHTPTLITHHPSITIHHLPRVNPILSLGTYPRVSSRQPARTDPAPVPQSSPPTPPPPPRIRVFPASVCHALPTKHTLACSYTPHPPALACTHAQTTTFSLP